MEPRIQYAKTSDGVNIAYAVLGEGTPLLLAGTIFGRLHLYARTPKALTKFEDSLVQEGFRVVVYDGRGMGFSDRSSSDFSHAGRLLDLEAVVDAARLEPFALAMTGTGFRAAATYAAGQPQKITHFVASNPITALRELRESNPMLRMVRGMRSMTSDEWETVTLTMARVFFEFAESELARAIAAVYREGISPSAFLAYSEASELEFDPPFHAISVPSLLIYDRSVGGPGSKGSAQRLAPRIPGARFVETDNAARAIREFVGGAIPRIDGQPHTPSGTAVILFADIADSTALTERLGDAAFRAKARDLDGALRGVIRDHAGTPIDGKLLGDGVLAVFTSARQAIEAALGCGRAGAEAGVPLHLGLHAGDVIREDNNVYGGAVNIAARISGLSTPGDVLVSDTVRSLARTSAGVRFDDRGERALKGVGDAVRVWAVREAE